MITFRVGKRAASLVPQAHTRKVRSVNADLAGIVERALIDQTVLAGAYRQADAEEPAGIDGYRPLVEHAPGVEARGTFNRQDTHGIHGEQAAALHHDGFKLPPTYRSG